MTFEDWYELGLRHGHCGAVLCVTHDGMPMTDEEADEDEACIPMVRLYEDEATRLAVEAAHSPSVWRKQMT